MRLYKDTIPLKSGYTIASINDAIGEALTKGATKLLIDKNKNYLLYQRPLLEGEEELPEQADVYRITRLKEIYEIETPPRAHLKDDLFDMFTIISDRNFYPNFILVKDKKQLLKRLDIPSHKILNQFLGAKVYEYDEVENDVVLVCGTSSRTADPFDIVYSVKGYM